MWWVCCVGEGCSRIHSKKKRGEMKIHWNYFYINMSITIISRWCVLYTLIGELISFKEISQILVHFLPTQTCTYTSSESWHGSSSSTTLEKYQTHQSRSDQTSSNVARRRDLFQRRMSLFIDETNIFKNKTNTYHWSIYRITNRILTPDSYVQKNELSSFVESAHWFLQFLHTQKREN